MHDRRIALAAAGSARGRAVPPRSARPLSTVPSVIAAGYGLALALVGGVLIGYADGAGAWSGLGSGLVAAGVVLALAGVLLGQRTAPKPQRREAPAGVPDVAAEMLPAQLVLPPMPAAGVDILAAGITADLGELLRRGPSTADATAAGAAADLGELLRRVALIARQCPPSESRPEVEVTVRLPALQSRDTARAFVLALCSLVFFLVALVSSKRDRSRG